MSISFGATPSVVTNIASLTVGLSNTANNIQEKVYRVTNAAGVKGNVWQTVATIVYSASSSFGASIVEVHAAGFAGGAGGGSRFTRFCLRRTGTTMSANIMNTSTSDVYSPNIQMTFSGNNCYVQVLGSTAGGAGSTWNGTVFVKLYACDGQLQTETVTLT